tara:strand:- start:152 stop:535 length:384 start_codon:yes stop_codon:yes gene_type:complete
MSQQKIAQFQALQQHLEQIQEHIQLLHQQNAELENSKEALAELQQEKVNSQILAPIANGIFVKGELKDNRELLVNVGGDVVVEKKVKEVIGLLEEQQQELRLKVEQAEGILQHFHSQALQIYKEIEQ